MDPIPSIPLALDATGMQLHAGMGLAQQIHAQLKTRILQGQLAATARLPTTRQMALQLGVARNTVVRAYEQLQSEGLLDSRVGAGYYVARLAIPAVRGEPLKAATMGQPSAALWERLQAFPAMPEPATFTPAFRHGLPALDLFPHALWSRLQARFWRQQARLPGGAAMGYGDPAGLPRLRAQIAAYLSHSRKLHCRPEQVLVTAGSQQAIAMLAMVLLNAGDRVGMESPGYRAASAALALTGAEIVPVPVDAQGLRVAALEALGPLRLVYTTPAHQFPTGVAMSMARRLALLDWAKRHQAFVLEDDYDGEYRFGGVPLAPLAALDASRTLYIGSFSKLLFPALRLGYLVVPPDWLPKLARLRSLLDRQTSIADQHAMADFIAEGHFLRHVRRMRRAAQERRDTLLGAWQQDLTPALPAAYQALRLLPVDAGLQAYLPLPSRALEARLLASAQAAGIELGGLGILGGLPAHSQQAGLVLGFAAHTPAQIRRQLKVLAGAWAQALA